MFIIIPTGVDYEARRWPVVTFTLMGINTLIHLWSMSLWVHDEESYKWWMDTFWLTPASSPWYTYFTSMFVHGGILHLVGNMVYLFLFGSCVEDLIGRWRYIIFYLLGGLVSAFGHILTFPGHFDSNIPLGGASGAISACMGGYVLLLHKTRIDFKWIFFFMFRLFNGEFTLPAWLVMSLWFGQDLLGMVLSAVGPSTGGGTAFGAHVGGFIIGMGMIGALKPLLRREEAREEAAELAAESPPPEKPVVSPIPPEAAIYVFDNGIQSGPFNLGEFWSQLQSGQVTRDASYWYEGMDGWHSVQEML